MTNAPESSHLGLHLLAAAVYLIAAIIFIDAWMGACTLRARWMAFVLIVGPAAYYPITYFALKALGTGGHEYVRFLGGLWGPLWAALGAVWGFLVVQD
jgi:hypothetical protein